MKHLRTLTKSEWLLGGLFALVSVAVLAALLSKGRALGGAESQVGADQLQYLSWIVSASETGFINSFWSIPSQTGSAFLHPGFGFSGLLTKLGVPVIVSYQLWKVVAIPAVVIAAIAWSRRFLPKGGARTVGLALILFGLSPVGAFIGWNSLSGGYRAQVEFVAGEVFAPAWLWGYMMTAIAVAALFGCLLLAERHRAEDSPSWVSWTLPLLALICSWLQPWQGAELIGVVVVADVARRETALRALMIKRLPLLIAALAPLVYYKWLASTEDVWRIASDANNEVPLWSIGVWAAALLPWLPAAFAYRKHPADWGEFVLMLMPVVMILEYFAIAVSGSGTFPFHAIQGLGFCLGVLAVRGSLSLRPASWWRERPYLAVGLCVLMCVPGTLHRLNLMRLEIHKSVQPYFLEPGEVEALRFLKDSKREGGVLAPIKAGLTVPAHSERATWVGELSWTPDFRRRVEIAEAFFKGQLSEDDATRLIKSSGAVFLYADCGHRADLGSALAGRVVRVEAFGCARVWELK